MKFAYGVGRRQEGIFFGAVSFAGKAAGAFGHVIAGILVDVIGFPAQAEVGSVPAEKLAQLGLLNGPRPCSDQTVAPLALPSDP